MYGKLLLKSVENKGKFLPDPPNPGGLGVPVQNAATPRQESE